MSDQLKSGDHVSSSERRFKVVKEIGSGGQGHVYLVTEDGHPYALKWYNQTASTPEQFQAIEVLIEKGAPSDLFVWPIALVEGLSRDNFGYVMPLIDNKRYTKLSHYFSGEVEVKRFEPIIDACIRMAHGFNELHLNGLCYRDISFGNLFIDFESGDVLICDNDNVTFDNLTEKEDIWGTQGFMAPEVVRGESPPSAQTDLFSLAVVLFRLLNKQHPLQGKKEYEIDIIDLEALTELYGTNPLFIYDPIDETNRPVKGKKDIAEAYWPYYPTFIKDRFIEAFTLGLQDPNHRVRESIWIKDLSRLRGSLMYCYACGAQVYYDKAKVGQMGHCPKCQQALQTLPPRLKVGETILMLNHDTTLFMNQIDGTKIMDYETPFARVEVHPKHPQVWGLRNLTEVTWQYALNDQSIKEVHKNDVLPIKDQLEVYFGTIVGNLRTGSNIPQK